MKTNYVLGGPIAGLAAGMSGVTVLDEDFVGPSGADIAYYVLPGTKTRIYKADWTDDGAECLAYQFWATGLSPMRYPDPLALKFIRKFSNVAMMPFVVRDFFDQRADEPADIAAFILDGPRLVEGLANRCHLKKNYALAGLDLEKRTIKVANRMGFTYKTLLSTLPLDYAVSLTPECKALGWRRTARDVQVLNVGMVPFEDIPMNDGVHVVSLPRDGTRLIDSIERYDRVHSSFIPGDNDGWSRISFAVKHGVGANEIPLSSQGFRDRILKELVDLGFRGEIEVAEYHFLRSFWPNHRDHAIYPMLQEGELYQVGTLARGQRYDPGQDLMAGLVAGLCVA